MGLLFFSQLLRRGSRCDGNCWARTKNFNQSWLGNILAEVVRRSFCHLRVGGTYLDVLRISSCETLQAFSHEVLLCDMNFTTLWNHFASKNSWSLVINETSKADIAVMSVFEPLELPSKGSNMLLTANFTYSTTSRSTYQNCCCSPPSGNRHITQTTCTTFGQWFSHSLF